MRSVRVLWGIIGVLLASVLVLAILLVRSSGITPGPGPLTPPSSDRSGQPDAGDKDKIIAVIGSRKISYGELQQRLTDKYGAELLNQMLDREAIRQEAEEIGLTVSRTDVEKELKRMQQGYENEDQFYKSMKEQLGLTKAELSEDVYYKLLLERIATRTVQVTEEEVQTYIKDHPEEFKSFVQYHLAKIEVKTREEASQVLKDLHNGADFASLAKAQSIDESSANQGGDLGWVEENDPYLSPFILEAARNLEIGEVSNPIPLKNSYAIIMLKEKKEIRKVIDDDTKQFVRKELALQKAPPLKDVVKSLREKRNATVLVPELR